MTSRFSISFQQTGLFDQAQVRPEILPLAERLRPRVWEDLQGQAAVIARLKDLASREFWPSLLLHGPPGCGKTSIINVLRASFPGVWIVGHGSELKASEIRELSEAGRQRKIIEGKQTLLFIDEIHALTKVQQETLLEPVEKGHLVILGATTENPVFFLRPALRSRLRLIELQALRSQEILPLLRKAQESLSSLSPQSLQVPEAHLELLAQAAQGDARRALVHFENLWDEQQRRNEVLDQDQILSLITEQQRPALAETDMHSNLSAMIKSIRGSDPDAALLWMTQLLEGGVDPRVILRRLLISASEDIGNAEPRALAVAVDAAQAYGWVGLPEGRIILSQAVIFLASCPKSDSAYISIKNAKALVEQGYPFKTPSHLQHLGKDSYVNPHEFARGWVKQRYRPEGLSPEVPVVSWSGRGQEKKMIEYLEWLRQSGASAKEQDS